MRLVDPAVPKGWQVEKTDAETTRVTVPQSGTGYGVVVGIGCAVATGLFPVASSHLRAWELLVMIPALALTVAVASLCLLMYVTNGQTWVLRSSRLEISRATWGDSRQTVSYRDCSLEIVLAESVNWELQLHGSHGSVTLHRSQEVRELLALYAFLEEELGWHEAPREKSPVYLRRVLELAVRENDPRQLWLILQDARALPWLAQLWREATAEARVPLLQLLTAVERSWGRFSELIELEGGDGQWMGIEVLEALEERRALPAFRRLVCEGVMPVRSRAALAIGRLRDAESVPALCESLKLQPELWPATVFALGQIGDPRAIPALGELLGAPETEKVKGLRQETVLALASFGDRAALPALEGALHDPGFRVRAQAAESLGKLGWREAVPALIEALQDSRWQVATKAATALGAIGDAGGVEPLIRALAHENPELRVCAVTALGELGGAAALAALCRSFGDREPRVRREAALAVARLVTLSADIPVDARAALPMLQQLRDEAPELESEIRAACELAIRNIEAATASVKQLPLSVGVQPLDPENLPLPAGRSR